MAAEIEALLDRAFGPGRHAKSSARVRERGARLEPELSRVLLSEAGDVIGICRIWRVRVGGARLCFLGPLAVDPEVQGAGLGARLVKDALTALRAAGEAGVIVMGAEAFFAPLGFSRVPEGAVTLPGPFATERLLWLELKPSGLIGARGAIQEP